MTSEAPISSRTNLCANSTPGSNRRLLPTWTTSPVSAARSLSSRHYSTVVPSGFSTSTCLPAAIAVVRHDVELVGDRDDHRIDAPGRPASLRNRRTRSRAGGRPPSARAGHRPRRRWRTARHCAPCDMLQVRELGDRPAAEHADPDLPGVLGDHESPSAGVDDESRILDVPRRCTRQGHFGAAPCSPDLIPGPRASPAWAD